ncbi:hypothetical protein AAC387_Pa03g4367 [Persea americana]
MPHYYPGGGPFPFPQVAHSHSPLPQPQRLQVAHSPLLPEFLWPYYMGLRKLEQALTGIVLPARDMLLFSLSLPKCLLLAPHLAFFLGLGLEEMMDTRWFDPPHSSARQAVEQPGVVAVEQPVVVVVEPPQPPPLPPPPPSYCSYQGEQPPLPDRSMSLAGRTIPVRACSSLCNPILYGHKNPGSRGNGPLAEAEAVVGGNGNEPPVVGGNGQAEAVVGGMGKGHLW